MAREATAPLPPGIVVRADRRSLERSFGALIDLQPIRWTDDGLICGPRGAPGRAAAALGACPFPVAALSSLPAWPSVPARRLGDWYVRAPEHAPGPVHARELIQTDGSAFGPGGHATTSMCLMMLDRMPRRVALDAGCGSGLLAQAWVRAHDRGVLACDPDHTAIAQASRSLADAGIAERVELTSRLVQRLSAEQTRGRVILANLPAEAHLALISRLRERPPGVIASGIHGTSARAVRDAYRGLGMRVVHVARAGRWHCYGLTPR